MQRIIMLIAFFMQAITGKSQSDFDSYPVYNGKDLGIIYTNRQTQFKIWSPPATEARLQLYSTTEGQAVEIIAMQKSEAGTWVATKGGDVKGMYYTFSVNINGLWGKEVPDPYAIAVGVNGKRAMVVDTKDTNPDGWLHDRSPRFATATDAIIYELHIRDASISPTSGIVQKGKFAGLTETGTINNEGLATGLDHLKEMGVTHIHLLPFFDFLSVDETNLFAPQYNWGYEPLNYNVPEGSYATNATDGISRIKELKQLVQIFHSNGLRIVMDVVFNHTMLTEGSCFNQLVPGYYYRHTSDGKFSNATACGNETASERPMMRKFMLESLLYWVKEYHIDGFRFDLMGVHDIETMNVIAKELRSVKSDILLYGEGWTAGSSPLPDSIRAIKKNAVLLDNIAVFSDDIRDGIKGSVFQQADKGFVSGKKGMEESIKFGVTAACKHPQVDYSKVNYSASPYASQPSNTITYAECHDNHVLWDKLAISAKDASEAARKEMHKLALAIVLTSQGISFLHAGTEFLRSKKGNENSYNAGDTINAIDWSLKTKNRDVVEYIQLLIKIRKEHPAFRLTTTEQVATLLFFEQNVPEGVVAFTINGNAVKDKWNKVLVYYNGNNSSQNIALNKENWKAAILNNQPGNDSNMLQTLPLQPYSCTILYQ
jgi:pullulanase